MRLFALGLVAFAAAGRPALAQPASEPLSRLQALVGQWRGTADGQAGHGSVEHEYSALLGSRFVQVRNRSTYPPQEKNPRGETHEDVGIFSFDKARTQIVYRQFHSEGFVNRYVQTPASAPATLVLTSEAIENIPAGWRARETYRLLGPDEFEEAFELGEPGKEFALYSRTHLTRVPAADDLEAALKPFAPLLGEWQAAPGAAGETGGFAFRSSVQGRVIVRTNYAVYPAAAGKPASRHDDLMVIAVEGGSPRADYFDSEGHVIHYAVQSPAPGQPTFVGELEPDQPRYRLRYTVNADGTLAGDFEVAPPGAPERFVPYLRWSARRRD